MKSSSANLHFKGNLKEGFVLLQGLLMPTLNPYPFTGEFIKIPLPFVKRKLSQYWCTKWHLLTLKASSVISQQSLFLLQRGLLCCLAWRKLSLFDLAKSGLKPILQRVSLKLHIFQTLDWVLWVSIWGRNESNTIQGHKGL